MGILDRLTYTGSILAVLVAIVVFLGFLAGQPVLVSYVETGSMEPTIDAGEGFLVVPGAVADEPEPGDVVIFEAQKVGGGGLTTHRIVKKTDQGYITQGDANPSTDQAAGEPLVSEEQIAAVAVHVDGNPVTVPGVGAAIQGIETLFSPIATTADGSAASRVSPPALLFGIGLLLVGGGVLLDGRTRRRDRSQDTNGCSVTTIIGIVVVAAVIAAIIAMVVPSGPVQYSIAVTDDPPDDDPLAVEPGGGTTIPYKTTNAGLAPTLVILESEDVKLADDVLIVGPRGTAESEFIEVPKKQGQHELSVTEQRYLLALPPSVLLALHELHPFAPITGVNVVLALVIAGAGTLLVGPNRVLLRNRKREVPLILRIRKWLQ